MGSKKPVKRLPIPALAVVDNIVFSKSNITAYYRVNNQIFEFLSRATQISDAREVARAFASLLGTSSESREVSVISTTSPIDVDAWRNQVVEVADNWEEHNEKLNKLVRRQYEHMARKQYLESVSYIGVSLGKRGALDTQALNPFESGFRGAKDAIFGWASEVTKTKTGAITEREENMARSAEGETFRTIRSSKFEARRATTEEILLMIKRPLYPAMPVPYLDVDPGTRASEGDIDFESAAAVAKKFRHVEITQMIGNQEVTGYRATLTMARFPKAIYFPDSLPFLYLPKMAATPFTCYAHIVIHPSDVMKKKLEHKKNEAKDELKNRAVGANALDEAVTSNVDTSDNLQDIYDMEDDLANKKEPWIEATYRLNFEAASLEDLKDICAGYTRAYKDQEIVLRWTAGNQIDLLMEQMPGARRIDKTFAQVTDLNGIAISGFNFASDVGDPIVGSNHS